MFSKTTDPERIENLGHDRKRGVIKLTEIYIFYGYHL